MASPFNDFENEFRKHHRTAKLLTAFILTLQLLLTIILISAAACGLIWLFATI